MFVQLPDDEEGAENSKNNAEENVREVEEAAAIANPRKVFCDGLVLNFGLFFLLTYLSLILFNRFVYRIV